MTTMTLDDITASIMRRHMSIAHVFAASRRHCRLSVWGAISVTSALSVARHDGSTTAGSEATTHGTGAKRADELNNHSANDLVQINPRLGSTSHPGIIFE